MFYLIVYFVQILTFVACCATANRPDQTSSGGNNGFFRSSLAAQRLRIVGGHNTSIAEHPYMVSIRYRDHFICGGTLISQKCILTAAHCSILDSPGSWQIHAGTPHIESRGLVRNVRKWMVPAEFNFLTIDMDVAVVKLNRPLFSRSVRPIEIDYMPLNDDDVLIVAGWGLKEEYPMARLSNDLQAVRVTPTSFGECRTMYMPENNITVNMFCATGNWGSGDACQGDSGGPAIRNGKQVGIVSWGYRCGLPDFPGVYTRLSSDNVMRFLQYTIAKYC